MEEYTGPLVAECKRKQRQYPGVPLFLLGHSMGGLIALASLPQTLLTRGCSSAWP